MKGICALYDIETELMVSHIYPKFVINYTKRTGSKYLRAFINPNVRIQDGIKIRLLSERAEQDFSLKEKWFAENIFYPYLHHRLEFEYNKNLYYFTVSFLWRILIVELRHDDVHKDKWYYNIVLNAEKEWKGYLTGGALPSNYSQFCLLLTDRVVDNNSDLKGVDYYFTRILDGTIVYNETQTSLLVYGKFNKFIFWAVLKNSGGEDNLNDVEINPNGGILKVPQELDYYPITSFFGNRITQVEQLGYASEVQQRKILQEILNDPESFFKSDVGQSLYNDYLNLDE